MHPSPSIDDVLLPKGLIVAAAAVSVDIALESFSENPGSVACSCPGRIHRQSEVDRCFSDIVPRPSLLDPAVLLELKKNHGVTCEKRVALKHGYLQLISKGAGCIIDLKSPTGLGSSFFY